MARSNSTVDIPLTEGNRRLELEDLFRQVDADGDGFVCYTELWQFLQMDNHKIARHIIKKVHERADRNDDGKLDCQEFVRMVTDPENKYYFGQYMNRYIHFLLPPQPCQTKVGPDGRGFDTHDGQYEERYSCWPPKVSMILISLTIIVFYTIDAVQNETTGSGPMGKVLIYNPHRRREAWRYVSYMFVHIGFFHLFVNLLIQLLLGVPLEMVHKWWRVLIVYLCGVLAGSLGTSVTDPSVYLAGASGGVYSLMTAHIATIIMNWKQMMYPLFQMMVFVIIICTDVGSSIYNRYVDGKNDHIGYAAHFFGALAGLLVGITVLKNLEVTKREKMIKWGAWTLYLILMTTAVVINVVAPNFPAQHV